MATVKVKFRASTVEGKEGTLYYHLIHQRNLRWISTDYHVFPDEWNDKKSAIIISDRNNRQAHLQLIQSKIDWEMKQMQRMIFGFIIDGDMPFMERISQGVRAHFEFVRRNASLPNFIINELRRDPERIGDLIRKNLGIFGDSEGVMEEVTVAMQRELDLQAEAGVCRKMAAIMLLLDIVSLNVFVFVGMPMMDIMFPAISKDIDAFLDRRCEENVEVILNRLNS